LGILSGGEALNHNLTRVAEAVVENLADHDAVRRRILGLLRRLSVAMPDEAYEAI
jgi:hypothetical protein